MSGTVTPKTMYNREGFKMLGTEGKEGLGECKGGMDDEMECDDGNPGLLMKPLKIVLCSYLNRSWFGEGKMSGRAIEGPMVKLIVGKIGVEGSKLSIRPPILLGGKSVNKVGRTGGKGALCEFRGDY